MDLFDNESLIADRKRWHRLAAMMDDNTPRCNDCNGPLETVTDYINGIEYICKNPDCESNN